jgi:myo-inositol-1(or 4)-monophosphatase
MDVRSKGALGPVTDVDLAVDALLKDVLRAARPDYGWISEETAVDGSRLERARSWVVDPIDGTRAFVQGKPHWAVCIGLLEAGQPVLGVVFNPVLDECFWAGEGQGARLNGAPIGAASTGAIENCRMLGDAQMFRHPAWPQPWPPMQVEQRNSIAYRMCLVASGAFDAAVALSAKSDWDLAAADIIVREAGGACTDHQGAAFRYDRPEPKQLSLVASGSALHPLLIGRMDHIVLP